MYECVVYKYGSGIFNKESTSKKYRHDVIETFRFNCHDIEIYENKKPTNTILYLRRENDPNPIINVYFTSENSYKKYAKNNKEMLLKNYGKIGEDYFFEKLIYSHDDIRAK